VQYRAFLAAIALAATAVFATEPCAQQKGNNILFIFDNSRSMDEIIEGKKKIEIAKDVFKALILDLQDSANVGLMIFERGCKVKTVAGFGTPLNKVADRVKELTADAATPLAKALENAVSQFDNLSGQKNSVILISDGEEGCRGDPCDAAKTLASSAGIDVSIHVVGFDVPAEVADKLRCIYIEGGGHYFSARNEKELTAVLGDLKQEILHPWRDLLLWFISGLVLVILVIGGLYQKTSHKIAIEAAAKVLSEIKKIAREFKIRTTLSPLDRSRNVVGMPQITARVDPGRQKLMSERPLVSKPELCVRPRIDTGRQTIHSEGSLITNERRRS
jgi:hypothetical protein